MADNVDNVELAVGDGGEVWERWRGWRGVAIRVLDGVVMEVDGAGQQRRTLSRIAGVPVGYSGIMPGGRAHNAGQVHNKAGIIDGIGEVQSAQLTSPGHGVRVRV